MSRADPQAAAIPIPYRGRFEYSRAERVADGVVHGIGLVLALTTGILFLVFASRVAPIEYAAGAVHAAALATVLTVSLLYNMWPISPAKWVLRRFDHAGIYLLIAATYAPFLTQVEDVATAATMGGIVGGGALIGIALKLFLPGRFDRLAVAFYLLIGWSGVLMLGTLAGTLPRSTLWLLGAGGLVYSAGVAFYIWQRLRFHNVVWHGFVVTGAALHLAAVADVMVFQRW